MPVDTNWASVVLLAEFDEEVGSAAFFDKSKKNKTLVAAGNAAIAAVGDAADGRALVLDGTGDWVQTNSTLSDFAFGTGDFAVEAIIKTSKADEVIAEFYSTGTGTNGTWQLLVFGGKLQWQNAGSIIATGTSTISNGAKRHVAATRSGTTLRLFVDGVQEAAASHTRDLNTISPQFGIGAQINRSSTTRDFSGTIYGVRVTKGAARYTAGFTAPTEPFDLGVGVVPAWRPVTFGSPVLVPTAVGFKAGGFGIGSIPLVDSGFAPVNFGLAEGRNIQVASGFAVANLGAPVVKPIAVGFNPVNIGALTARQFNRVTALRVLSFGTPTTPTQRAIDAQGWLAAGLGVPTRVLQSVARARHSARRPLRAARFGIPSTPNVYRAGSFKPTRFGTPTT